MDLSNIDLLKLQTQRMQQDPTTQALCAALTTQLQQANKAIEALFDLSQYSNLEPEGPQEWDESLSVDGDTLLDQNRSWDVETGAEALINYIFNPVLDKMISAIMDELAWELHIDWYDSKADINTKKLLIKNSDKVHAYLGTPYAVELVMKDYFGEYSRLKEWFEYDGVPYTFKVVVYNQAVSGDQAERFTRALNAVKNARSVLDEIVYGYICSETLFCSDFLIII